MFKRKQIGMSRKPDETWEPIYETRHSQASRIFCKAYLLILLAFAIAVAVELVK